jgi:hypothetical protein
MSFTVDAVRRLVYVPELDDTQIQAYADDGYTDAIDVAIAICDYMATRTGGASKMIKVGPITIDKAASSQNWQQIKDNLIKRKLLGTGVPGGGVGLAGLTTFGAATLTGGGLSEPVYVGQFDNPPRYGASSE